MERRLLNLLLEFLVSRLPPGLDTQDLADFRARHEAELLAIVRKLLGPPEALTARGPEIPIHRLVEGMRVMLPDGRAGTVVSEQPYTYYEGDHPETLHVLARVQVDGGELLRSEGPFYEEHVDPAEKLFLEALDHRAEQDLDEDREVLARGAAEELGDVARWPAAVDPRGPLLPDAEKAEGMRVVLPDGRHGTLTEVTRFHMAPIFGDTGRSESITTVQVRLDSGATVLPQGPLYREVGPPPAVVPDVVYEGRAVEPAEFWKALGWQQGAIQASLGRATRARSATNRGIHEGAAAHGRRAFSKMWAAWSAWRAEHPHVAVPGVDPLSERRLALLALPEEERTAADNAEIAILSHVPTDWRTRWKVGDPVLFFDRTMPSGPTYTTGGKMHGGGWSVLAIEGDQALLGRGEARRVVPLYFLDRDATARAAAQAELPPVTEPRWLMDLARDLLAETSSQTWYYPERGAVAQAVKGYLAENGVAVRTHVQQGGGNTRISLYPDKGLVFSAEARRRLGELLQGFGWYGDGEVVFEPWQREEDTGYKIAGLRIPAAYVHRFGYHLARGLQSAGQALSRQGEVTLAAGAQDRAPEPRDGRRGGVTAEQRAQAAEGCQSLDFVLPLYGRVQVECGQEGRRDTWHNVRVGGARYGFNGGRWARGKVPDATILRAIWDRGVRIFGEV